ncbi:hypothetical protein D9756_010698 [Leucocoprinus leucothites]|uniref:Uncharacterized protein n=1 Tax=Leucocoprinus leucothites TaxID=201217 RepID=A0A8H5CTF8_9AGAR|nr:hypothetical protein D9756_010698 [Leucoagaricus leucothites]
MYSQNMNYAYGFHTDQGADPNSTEAFEQNLQMTLQHVATLREHARRGLAGIQYAYHVGRNPSQTQLDIAAAKQTLAAIIDLMQKSGVGALPLLEADASGHTEVPTEAQLMEKATKGVQANFEKLKRAQESAAVVANLLGTEHRPQKP